MYVTQCTYVIFSECTIVDLEVTSLHALVPDIIQIQNSSSPGVVINRGTTKERFNLLERHSALVNLFAQQPRTLSR